MDAFAARQLAKRKLKEDQKKREQELDDRPLDEKLNREERIQVNRIFGLLDPPTDCSAVGNNLFVTMQLYLT
jgi:hypothetical protein